MRIKEGEIFSSRKELQEKGLHRRHMAGIDGNKAEGARAIVLSGGYEDDEDRGDYIIYTGEGGQDPETREQVADQKYVRGNEWLEISKKNKTPVRVFRKVSDGYEYGGQFLVTGQSYEKMPTHGCRVFRFRLVKNPSTGFNYEPNLSLPDPGSESSGGSGSAPGDRQPPRIPDIVWRIVRTQAGEWVKKLYKFECQVCGECLETRAGRYAHGAHIQPLGRPFNGPDIKENILCLCPNHHALFDNGGFGIAEDFGLIGLRGSLRSDPSHELNPAYFEWHRTNILPMATG